jgi:7,8-dihydro-6-hydroxymethylpterin-pyrophosphokinase
MSPHDLNMGSPAPYYAAALSTNQQPADIWVTTTSGLYDVPTVPTRRASPDMLELAAQRRAGLMELNHMRELGATETEMNNVAAELSRRRPVCAQTHRTLPAL